MGKMKGRLGWVTAVAALVGCLSLAALLIHRFIDRPILKSPLQGGEVVTLLEREFSIPEDPMEERPGVFCSSWTYWRGFDWNAGCEILICGVYDTETQNQMIVRIRREVKSRKLCDVMVVFQGDTRVAKGVNWTRRIEGPELRRERIIGATRSWRELRQNRE